MLAVAVWLAAALALAQGSSPKPAAQPGFAALAARADAARKAEQLDQAAALYRRALKLNPRWAEGWWSLGTLDYDADRYAEAALELVKVVELDPKQGTARAMLGLCQFRLGDDRHALENIEAAKQIGIADDEQLRQVVSYHEGVLLARAGRFEAAEEPLNALCKQAAADDQVRRALGMAVLRMRDLAPPAPNSLAAQIVAHIGRGACLAAKKDYDAARREYDLVERHAPHFPWLHYACGRLLEQARDPDAAVAEFKLEIAEQPSAVLPRLRIASALYKRDSAAGLPFAQQALELEPELPLAHYILGLLQLDTGAYAEAIPHLERARKAFPVKARIALSLAAAYSHVGRPEDAARERQQFQKLSALEKQAASDNAPAETDANPLGDTTEILSPK